MIPRRNDTWNEKKMTQTWDTTNTKSIKKLLPSREKKTNKVKTKMSRVMVYSIKQASFSSHRSSTQKPEQDLVKKNKKRKAKKRVIPVQELSGQRSPFSIRKAKRALVKRNSQRFKQKIVEHITEMVDSGSSEPDLNWNWTAGKREWSLIYIYEIFQRG